jgi:hypothetical protein
MTDLTQLFHNLNINESTVPFDIDHFHFCHFAELWNFV